ncbi:hypothetical protein NQ317_012633 [Molorchus minor]|uniref:poly(ADP-ribose) glycohydrolase n=1 Tax=Molorchus minor TaxID=1323400 RepID=A0ABQ9J5K8_9CUCU|nr:hypothetical protein NQ317_012633 [Molorchus minor]
MHFSALFLGKKDSAALYPGVNFVSSGHMLFAAHARPKRQSCVSEKIKCILNYFRRVLDKSPVGVLTFERKFIPQSLIPRWDTQENNLGNTKIHIDSEGTIEENGLGFLQVDFANKNVGGGVLGYGCVQEEIRFVICPELIISRLFVEQLGDHEAVIVSGSEQYSKYSGYGDTFKWEGNNYDTTPHDEYGRRKTTICIIDATRFNKPSDQFYASAILREINKAYVGFSSRDKDNLAPVATGNWGCGAFRGSCELKSLIQLIACSVANRDLVYYSFGNENLRDELYNMHTFLANNRVTVAQLWRFLCGFSTLGLPQEKLYSYIQQALFDITEIKSKQNCKSDSIEDLDLYLPFYPQTSTSSEASEKKQKHRLSAENISPKVTTTDITEIIDIIDGNTNRPKKQNVEVSMSAELDRFKKKDQRQEPSGHLSLIVSHIIIWELKD